MLADAKKLIYLLKHRPSNEYFGLTVDFLIAPWQLRWAYEAEVEFQGKLRAAFKSKGDVL